MSFNLLNKLILYFRKPFSLEKLHPYLRRDGVNLLDIGCGNHAPTTTKSYYPRIQYYGLDRAKDYNLDSLDFAVMKAFYEVELPDGNLKPVPVDFFDVIIMQHVIEHIPDGKNCLSGIIEKLKRNGIIYLEFPAERSTRLPRLKGGLFQGGLNFYDDPSHVNVYSRHEIEEALKSCGCKILNSGTRRSWKRIIFMSFYILYSLKEWRFINGGAFWDLCGFAEYIVARKG